MTQSNPNERLRSSSRSIMEHSIISFRNTSQYSAGGPSACGLASVNAARTILTMCARNEPVRHSLEQEETAMSIMAICQYWHSNEHLEVQDILNLPLFQCQLETVRVDQKPSTLTNFRELTRSIAQGGACAAVVTRAPEIVSLMGIPREEGRKHNLLVIFDSHPRPEHPLGAAFLLFYSPDAAATYLSKLFHTDASIMREDNWQTQMLSHYNAHVMQARPFTEDDEIKAIYTANTELLRTSATIKEAVIRESEVRSELHELRQRLERQREARRQASEAESEADRKLRALRKELQSAREFASSLSGMKPMQTNWSPPHPAIIDSHPSTDPSRYHGSNAKGKGKAIGTGGVVDAPTAPPRTAPNPAIMRMQRPGPSAHQFQQTASLAGNEMEEYEKVRLAGLAAKSEERKKKLQAERELAQRRAQDEAERNNYEAALQLQLEEERVALQQAELLSNLDKGFTCPICMDKWSVGMVSRVDSCGHEICRDCMVGHVQSELGERRWPIICAMCRASPPENGEQGTISRVVFEFAGADEESMSKWTEVELASISVSVQCPTCGKSFPVAQDEYKATEMLWCIVTPGCPAYWCKTCSQPATRGVRHTCDGQAEFSRWKGEQKEGKDCPGCGLFIQRTEGCNHMSCAAPGCNTHFCDRCGAFIVKSQAKNAITAALTEHYSKCKLFEYE